MSGADLLVKVITCLRRWQYGQSSLCSAHYLRVLHLLHTWFPSFTSVTSVLPGAVAQSLGEPAGAARGHRLQGANHAAGPETWWSVLAPARLPGACALTVSEFPHLCARTDVCQPHVS